MSAKNPKKFFGTCLVVTGFLYFIFTLSQLLISYYDTVAVTDLVPFTDKLETFGFILEFSASKMLPLSLLAICAGGIAYPQLLSKLTRSFTLTVGGLIILLNGYYWATNPSDYCGVESIHKCAAEVAPVIFLVLFLGAMAKAVGEAEALKS